MKRMDIFESLVNDSHLKILRELFHWCVMDRPSLKKAVDYDGSDISFYRFLERMEKVGLLQSTKFYKNKFKYYYLSPNSKYFFPDEVFPELVNSELEHDAKASVLASYFLQSGKFEGVTMEPKGKQVGYGMEVVPDAVALSKESRKRIAIELEMHQKSRTRLEKKFDFYFKSQSYAQVFYFFKRQVDFDKYVNFFKEKLLEVSQGDTSLIQGRKFLFGLVMDMHKRVPNFAEAQVYCYERGMMRLGDLLFPS